MTPRGSVQMVAKHPVCQKLPMPVAGLLFYCCSLLVCLEIMFSHYYNDGYLFYGSNYKEIPALLDARTLWGHGRQGSL